jgi:hypothetical protein
MAGREEGEPFRMFLRRIKHDRDTRRVFSESGSVARLPPRIRGVFRKAAARTVFDLRSAV